MVINPQIPDEELARRSAQGDRDAFAELYARYFQGLYDLTFRMVRDQEIAADLVQNSFIRAWESLQKRTVSDNIRAWLYAIARNTAINEIRRKKRWGAVLASEPNREELKPFEGIDTSRLSNPESALEAQELVELVWESAAALGPKDYSLLDLHLRKDLAPGEIAAGLGLPNARVHTMLSRLRSSLEESVGIALLIRRGRRDCPRLNEILYRRQGEALDRDIKLEVRRHLQECEQCAASRKRFAAPAEIFSAIALVPVSDETAAGVWSKVSPLLVPGAGAIGGGVTVAGSRAVRWWAQADAGLKVATVAVLGAVIALPVAVSILVMSTGGSADPGGPGGTDLNRNVGIGASRTKSPQSTSTSVGFASPSATPVVAGVVESPAPTSSGGPTTTLPAGFTPTAAPTPAPTLAGQTPTSTPEPTATPAPANQADVAVTDVQVSVLPLATPTAGQPFYLSVTAMLWNYGGAGTVFVDTTFAFTDAAGCATSPPVTDQGEVLATNTDKAINVTFRVTCPSAASYTFAITASVTFAAEQALTDPNPANNTRSSLPKVVPVQ